MRGQLPKAFAGRASTAATSLLVTDVGETVDCTVSSGAQTKPVAVQVEDEEGHVSIS